MLYANNKGAEQPAHPRSLISAFVTRSIDSIIPLVSISEIASLYLASVAAKGRFVFYLVANPEDRFTRDMAHLMLVLFIFILTYQYSGSSFLSLSIQRPFHVVSVLTSIYCHFTFCQSYLICNVVSTLFPYLPGFKFVFASCQY